MKPKFSHLFIAFAALAQGVMWYNLFVVLGMVDGYAIAGGACAGIATVGMSTRTANFLPGTSLGKRARQWGWAVLIIFTIVEMIVLGTANFMQMPVKNWAVAYGASLVITLALLAGALVDRSLVPAEKSKKTVAQVAETGKQPKRKAAKVARKPVKDESLLAYFQGNPGASDTQAAEHFGISRQAIGQRRKKLYKVDIR